MSDQVLIALCTGIISLLTAVFGGIMTYMMARLKQEVVVGNRATDEVGQKIDNAATTAVTAAVVVRERLDLSAGTTHAKLEEIADVGLITKKLVNGNMTAMLQKIATLSRRVADMTHAGADEELADEAQALAKQHEDQETIIMQDAAAKKALK